MEQTNSVAIAKDEKSPITDNVLHNANAGKYLSFVLGEEEYGLEILMVREILGILEITVLPQTPNYVKGVINLRGTVVPVIDLRSKFCMPEKEHTKETCIIVINTHNMLTGMIVDTVSEVRNIDQMDIDPPPFFGTADKAEFMTGIGKIEGKVIILLDVLKILSPEQVKAIEEVKDSSRNN